MSANECIDTVRECLQRGASHYILKPVTQKEIQSLWQYAYRTATRPALACDPPAAPATPSPDDPIPATGVATIATKPAGPRTPTPQLLPTPAPISSLAPAGTNMPLNSALESLSLPWRTRLTIFCHLLHHTRTAFDATSPTSLGARLTPHPHAFTNAASVLISPSTGATAACHTPPHHFSSHFYRAPHSRASTPSCPFPRTYDAAAATYALGVLLLELAMAPSPPKVRTEYLSALPRVPASLLSAKPDVAVLILRMTARNAGERPSLAQLTRERTIHAVYSMVAATASVVANQQAAGSVVVRRAFLQKVRESRECHIAGVTADLECIEMDLCRVRPLHDSISPQPLPLACCPTRPVVCVRIFVVQRRCSRWSSPCHAGVNTPVRAVNFTAGACVRWREGCVGRGGDAGEVTQVHAALQQVQQESGRLQGRGDDAADVAAHAAAETGGAPCRGEEALPPVPARIAWPRRARGCGGGGAALSAEPAVDDAGEGGAAARGCSETPGEGSPAAPRNGATKNGVCKNGVIRNGGVDISVAKVELLEEDAYEHPRKRHCPGEGGVAAHKSEDALEGIHVAASATRSRSPSAATPVDRNPNRACGARSVDGSPVHSAAATREGAASNGLLRPPVKSRPVPDLVRDRWDHVEPLAMQLFGTYRSAARADRVAREGSLETVCSPGAGAAAGAADPQLNTAPWLQAVATDLQAVARFRWLPVVSSVQHAPSNTVDGNSGRRMVCAVALDRCEENLAVIGAPLQLSPSCEREPVPQQLSCPVRLTGQDSLTRGRPACERRCHSVGNLDGCCRCRCEQDDPTVPVCQHDGRAPAAVRAAVPRQRPRGPVQTHERVLQHVPAAPARGRGQRRRHHAAGHRRQHGAVAL